jgi:hypothetical protein
MPVLDEMMNGGLVIPGKGEGDSLRARERTTLLCLRIARHCLQRVVYTSVF